MIKEGDIDGVTWTLNESGLHEHDPKQDILRADADADADADVFA